MKAASADEAVAPALAALLKLVVVVVVLLVVVLESVALGAAAIFVGFAALFVLLSVCGQRKRAGEQRGSAGNQFVLHGNLRGLECQCLRIPAMPLSAGDPPCPA